MEIHDPAKEDHYQFDETPEPRVSTLTHLRYRVEAALLAGWAATGRRYAGRLVYEYDQLRTYLGHERARRDADQERTW